MSERIKIMYRRTSKIIIFVAALLGGILTFHENILKALDTANDYNPFSENNSEPVIKIGMSFKEVERELGKPHEVDLTGASYFSDGLKISPDYEFPDKVGGITLERMPSGVNFKGRVDGVVLGTTFDDVISLKGKPVFWGGDLKESSTAVWANGNLLTIINFKLGADESLIVKSITKTKQASVIAYEAVLLTAIQELKAGRVSIFLEELARRSKDTSFGDEGILTIQKFSKLHLHKKFELIAMQRHVGGGANIFAVFGETLLSFWIYPLGWETPTIRTIVDVEKFKKRIKNITKSSTG